MVKQRRTERTTGGRRLIVEETVIPAEAPAIDRAEPVAMIATAPPIAAAPAANNAPTTEPIPSMTNDNTAAGLSTTGSMMADSAASAVINRVRPGMAVVAADGETLGTVDHVKMGDPGAATVGADTPAAPGIFAAVFGAEGEPDVAEPFRDRLLRFGYVKIDGKGWLDTDRYVTADLIARVAGDTVTLSVAKHRLIEAA